MSAFESKADTALANPSFRISVYADRMSKFRGDIMRRRDFIKVIAGSATTVTIFGMARSPKLGP